MKPSSSTSDADTGASERTLAAGDGDAAGKRRPRLKTQVAIVGGGPSGLLLAVLLAGGGVKAVVLERRSRGHVLSRVRAGVLEQGTVDLLGEAGVGERAVAEGMVHQGVFVAFESRLQRIDLAGLAGGRAITIYGQTEVTRDLYAACDRLGIEIVDEAADVALHGIDGDSPYVTWRAGGGECRCDCDYVAGCDGFHGVSRRTIPPDVLREFERTYPFGWLGVLSPTRPLRSELVYASHERGFALCSMRSASLSRHYVQCPIDDGPDDWPDGRFWDELRRRLPAQAADGLECGDSIEKSVAPLRSYVAEPMSWKRLFLAGDAAHIVPPTGAKGLNLAASDVRCLSQAFIERYRDGDSAKLDSYSDTALARVWKAVRFSWWMTKLLHVFPDDDEFTRRLRRTELRYLADSRHAQAVWAENYTGLPQ